jgi:hypothetical protein
MSSLRGDRAPTYRTGPKFLSGARVENGLALCREANLQLDPWQEDVFRAGRAIRSSGQWQSLEVGVLVPRQNGKGAILEAVELDALYLDHDAKLILHSAHEMKTAYEAFLRIIEDLKSSDWLMERVKKIRYGIGQWSVEMVDGKRLRFIARSRGSGRGFSGDLIILDEAYNLTDASISAMYPTLSARKNPQVWFTSSAPLQHESSDVLRRICRRGRAGESKRLTYFEWCADKDDPVEDRAVWAKANPGLGIRLNEDVIEGELELMIVEDFTRERLGVWPDEEEDEGWEIISKVAWEACEREESEPVGEPVVAVDVAPNRDWGSIGWAAESNRGGVHVEVLAHRRGVKWLIPMLVALQEKTGSKVAIGVGSPAWALEEELKDAGVLLEEISKAGLAQGSGALFDAVAGDDESPPSLTHLGQPELDAAVKNADRRNYDDAWLWSRRLSEIDISPLVAVTLAYWVVCQRSVRVEDAIW